MTTKKCAICVGPIDDKKTDMMYDKKVRKKMKIIWGVLVVLIIVSMLMLYAPGLIPGLYS